jgi:fibronectin type 3 domain-containing protein
VNSLGEGPLSTEASVIPLAPTEPAKTLNLQAVAEGTNVTLTWDTPSSNGRSPITNYKIYRGTTPDGETLLTTVGNVSTYTDTGLTHGQTYYYKVSAVNDIGEGEQSNEVSVTISETPPSSDNSQTGYWLLILLVVVVVVVLLVIFLLMRRRRP